MKHSIRISILVPIYNAEKYLGECLNSLKSQKFDEMEFICLNDGSTDSSPEIIHRFAKEDSRFVVVDKGNEGFGKTLNRGIELARGEYVGFLESDDYAGQDVYQKLYEVARVSKRKPDIIKGNYASFREGIRTEHRIYDDFPYGVVLDPKDHPQLFMAGICYWSGIYRKQFLMDHELGFHCSPGASYQDTSFYYLCLMCAKSLVLVPDIIINYRTDNENSSSNNRRKVDSIFAEYDHLHLEMTKRNVDELFWKIEPVVRFSSYMFTFQRIMEYYKYPFLQRFRSEFLTLKDMGRIAPDLWSQGAYARLQLLLDDPERFYGVISGFGKELTDRNHRKLYGYLKNGLRKGILEESAVYIYGAGKIGQHVRELLKKAGASNIRAFLMTDKGGQPERIDDLPVIEAGSLAAGEKEIPVIVAVGEKYRDEIIQHAKDLGLTNLIIYDAFFRALWE